MWKSKINMCVCEIGGPLTNINMCVCQIGVRLSKINMSVCQIGGRYQILTCVFQTRWRLYKLNVCITNWRDTHVFLSIWKMVIKY